MKSRTIAAVLSISVLVVGVAVGVLLLQSNQTYFNRAAVPTGVGRVWLEPSGGEIRVGERQKVDIYFTTGEGSNAYPISAITLRMYVDNTDSAVNVVDENGEFGSLIINPDLLNTGNFVFPINEYSEENGYMTIDFALVDTTITGYKASEPQLMASFYVEADEAGMATFTIDNVESKMLTKADPPDDILQNPEVVSFMAVVDNQAPEAVTDFQVTDLSLDSASFQWTAPTDSGPTGSANTSIVVYSTEPITQGNWTSAQELGAISAQDAGSSVSQAFNQNFGRNNTYYFALVSFDDYDNYSEISNVVSAIPVAPDSTLELSFRLQSLAPNLGLNKQASVDMMMANGDTYNYLVNLSEANGIYSPIQPIVVNDIAPNTPRLSVKVPNYLRKSYNVISLNYGENTIAEIPTLTVGDFNGDNVIDITDIGLILSSYDQLSVSVNSENQDYDVNGDGNINITDVAIVLSNYTELVVYGDEI